MCASRLAIHPQTKFLKKSKESRPVLRFGKTRMESPWNLSRSEEGKKWLGLFSPLLLLLLHEMTRCEIYDSKRWRRKRRRRRRREVRQLLRLPSSFLREAALSGKYPPSQRGWRKIASPPPLHPPHFFPFLTARHKREREREP